MEDCMKDQLLSLVIPVFNEEEVLMDSFVRMDAAIAQNVFAANIGLIVFHRKNAPDNWLNLAFSRLLNLAHVEVDISFFFIVPPQWAFFCAGRDTQTQQNSQRQCQADYFQKTLHNILLKIYSDVSEK